MTRRRGWSLLSFVLVVALGATALPDIGAQAAPVSKANVKWVDSAPLPPGIVSVPPTKPKLPPTQPPEPASGPRHDAVEQIKAEQSHVPANAAGTPLRADMASQNAKLAAAKAAGLLAGTGPSDGLPRTERAKTESADGVDVQAAPATAVYGATYAPASGFDVNPRYDTSGQMWVTVTNTGNFTWAANTVNMGYHLYLSNGTIDNFNGVSTLISIAVKPGASVKVYSSVQFLPAGSFKLVWDLHDSTGFFSTHGVVAATAISFTVPHYPPTGIIDGPADGATTSTTTPQLSVLVAADGTVTNQIEYEICDSPTDTTGTCWNSGWLTVGWRAGSLTGMAYWTPAANTLKWNTAYYWHARVKDSSATTAWSAMSAVVPVVASPTGAHYATGGGATDQEGVDLFLNNYTRTEKDFTLQAPGFNLDFTRTYNSANPVQGLFGVGWSSILDMHRVVAASGIVTVTFPDGRQVDYGRDPDGTYVPGYGESSEALMLGTDEVRIGQADYWFNDTSGRLDHITPDTYSTDSTGHAHIQYSIVFHYNASSGLPTSITEGTDFTATLTYDSFGHLSSIAPSGQAAKEYGFESDSPQLMGVYSRRNDIGGWERLGYTNGATGLLDWFELMDGTSDYNIVYNTDGTVSTVTVPGEDSTASTWTYLRDPPLAGSNSNVALVQVVKDPRGLAMSYEFSYSGSLLARWAGSTFPTASTTRSWSPGPFGQVGSMLDENGNGTSWQWAPEGWLNAVTRYRDSQNSETTAYFHQVFDANGQLLAHTDPRYGLLTQSVDPNNHVVNMTYNANGSLLTEATAASRTAANASTTSYAYTCDNSSVPPTVVNDSAVAATTLQPCNLRASMTDPDGRVTTYGYDHLGRQTRVTTPAGQATNTTYDAYGNVVKKVVVNGAASAETDYTYDPDGHLRTELDPAATNQITGVVHQLLTTDLYDENGYIYSSVQSDTTPATAGGDAKRQTTYTHDALGNRTSIRVNGVTTDTATYDALGDMTKETDANGATFSYGYNQAGQPTYTDLTNFVDDPSVPTKARTVYLSMKYYDFAGRLQAVEDAMNHTVYYGYTNDDLKTTETFQGYQETPGAPAQDIALHTYTYDAAGNQISDTARGTSSDLNRVTTTGYDISNTRTTTTVDPGGLNRTTTYGYDPAGTLTSTTLSDGTRTESTADYYTPSGQLYQVSVHNDATPDQVSTYQRDTAGNVLASTDPRGSAAFGSTAAPSAAFTATDAYDPLGRLVSVTAPQVQVEDGSGAAPTTTAPHLVTGYDTFGEPTDVRNPDGAVTHTVYDTFGRKAEVDYPSAVQPDGSTAKPVEKWTYDKNGNVLTHLDKLGQTTTSTYDLRNRPLTVTQPSADGKAAPGVTKTVYDDANNPLSQIDPTGAQTLHTYDVAERLSTTVQVVRNGTATPTQYTTTYHYDGFGEVEFIQTADTTVSLGYNTAGQPTFSMQTGRGTTSYGYDVAGRQTSVTDPAGRTTRYTYDLAGHRTQVTQYDALTGAQDIQKYGYDTDGHLLSLTDGRGSVWSAAYDADGRLVSTTDPATVDNKGLTHPGAVTTTGYDAAGHPTRTTDADGDTTYQTYDSLGEAITRVEPATTAQPAAADRTWTASYDAAGLPADTTAPGGVTTASTYDNLGRLTGQTGSGAESATAAKQFGYDLDGRIVSLSSTALTPMTLAYDDRGLLIAAGDTPPGGTATVSYAAAYDAEGRLTHRVDTTGATDYTYSGMADVATETDVASGTTRAYTYDTDGQLKTENDSTSGTGTAGPSTAYTYDGLGRIASQTLAGPGGTQLGQVQYTWDPNGDLLTKTGTGSLGSEGAHTYTYDAADRLVDDTTSTGGQTSGQEQYGWDPVGNRTSVTDLNAAGATTSASTATFDQRDRLQTVTAPDSTTTYTWSARGTLAGTSKTVTATGATTATADKFDAFNRLTNDGSTTYTYDALDRLQNNGNGSSGLSQYAQDGLEPATDGTWNYARGPGAGGAPLAATPTGGGSPLSLQRDAHGDVIAGTDPKTGALAASRTFNAFGSVSAATGSLPNIGYQGSYTSPATGRTYAQSRWYDPTAGIFLSEDGAAPAAHNAVGTNLYAYAAANPTSAFDSNGQDCGIFSVVCDTFDEITQGLGDVAEQGASIIKQGADYVDSGLGDIESFLATEALPVAEEAGVLVGEAAVEGVACVIGCAELAVGGLIVLAIGGITYAFVVGADALIYDGTYNPTNGTDSGRATTAPGGDQQIQLSPPAAGQPQAPPPPPPYITGTKTVSSTSHWDTVSKWYDSQYLYTRVDHYSQTTTTVDTYWSDGSWYWRTIVSPVSDTWTITRQLLIDLRDPIKFATPHVTAADNRTPQDGQGEATGGTCGRGGDVLSCLGVGSDPLPQGAQTQTGGQGGDGGKPPWRPTGCSEAPRVWEHPRPGLRDTSKQDPLSPGDGFESLDPGQKLAEDYYYFIVRADGSLRAMSETFVDNSGQLFGHTSLAAGEDVIMAGSFEVDEHGNIFKFGNQSGHYRTSDEYGTCSMESISRDAFDQAGFPSPPEGAWVTVPWEPVP